MSLALSGLFVLTSFLVSGNPAVFIKTRGFPSLPHDRFGFIGIYSIYSAIAFNKMSVRSGVLKCQSYKMDFARQKTMKGENYGTFSCPARQKPAQRGGSG
jgi:hypothetical protein